MFVNIKVVKRQMNLSKPKWLQIKESSMIQFFKVGLLIISVEIYPGKSLQNTNGINCIMC